MLLEDVFRLRMVGRKFMELEASLQVDRRIMVNLIKIKGNISLSSQRSKNELEALDKVELRNGQKHGQAKNKNLGGGAFAVESQQLKHKLIFKRYGE